jgi:nitroreductase
MDVLEAIYSRTSVKAFRPDPVERSLVEKLLDAAVRAPNHRLTEPWGFYVLTGESKRRFAELRREDRAERFPDPAAPEVQAVLDRAYAGAIGTPVLIAVTTLLAEDPVQREEDYAATFCAIQNILLAAISLGLGTYLRTGSLLNDPALAELLGVPEDYRVVGIVYLGYPAEVAKLRPRTPATDKTRWLA